MRTEDGPIHSKTKLTLPLDIAINTALETIYVTRGEQIVLNRMKDRLLNPNPIGFNLKFLITQKTPRYLLLKTLCNQKLHTGAEW